MTRILIIENDIFKCKKIINCISQSNLNVKIYFGLIFNLINYFALHVIRPLLKSYGDSSTFTLSPGRIFM